MDHRFPTEMRTTMQKVIMWLAWTTRWFIQQNQLFLAMDKNLQWLYFIMLLLEMPLCSIIKMPIIIDRPFKVETDKVHYTHFISQRRIWVTLWPLAQHWLTASGQLNRGLLLLKCATSKHIRNKNVLSQCDNMSWQKTLIYEAVASLQKYLIYNSTCMQPLSKGWMLHVSWQVWCCVYSRVLVHCARSKSSGWQSQEKFKPSQTIGQDAAIVMNLATQVQN